jgi:hypothetical protein
MAATLLTNVVYPVYTRRSFIRHYTPGKWWDCLYTWDSGFTGLGLLELDTERAVDCLNAYTTPPGDPQAAFLHHGSLVPTQHYLFHELWNRTQDREIWNTSTRACASYLFFAGRLGSSTTRRMKSGLLKPGTTFTILAAGTTIRRSFRPPQPVGRHHHTRDQHSHGIRAAKSCSRLPELWANRKMCWSTGGHRAWEAVITDTPGMSRQAISATCVTRRTAALEFLHESGQNYNIDWTGPAFFAGACTPEQENLILERMAIAGAAVDSLGMCTVDKTGCLLRVDGYWNGAVWFPQQWFFWKALLDSGQTAFAAQIAATALDTWKAEVDASYHCFEHFIVQTGRGAGWHPFGGLSAPVLLWYGAYHRPGRLTTGLDTWLHSLQIKDYNQNLEAELEYQGAARRTFAVLAAMSPGKSYQAAWNGQPAPAYERFTGLLEIRLDGKSPKGRLSVYPTG